MNKMCFNCRLSALIWGYLHPNQVNGVGITTVCICASHLLRGPKVMGQNLSLKSGMHRHHQTLGFIPGDAMPGLYCNRLQFLLVLGAFSLQFCLQQVKCMLNRIQVRWLTWPLHNSPLLSLQKLFGCFCSMLWVIVHLHCEAPSNEFWSIWLNMSR